MTAKYAKDQASGFTNKIERVAIVGAGGGLGKYITHEILARGQHTVTALTRPDSTAKLPTGVKVAPVDYNDEANLVAALRGQQFLIIIMSVQAPPAIHTQLAQAAAKAGVPYVMPNWWGTDILNTKLNEEITNYGQAIKYIEAVEEAKVSSWIALTCGLWYEYSLVAGPTWFGFDFATKNITFFDDGNTPTNVTTWEQIGRAVAALLCLKELREDERDEGPAVSDWRNAQLCVDSFCVSQKDMFESWKRVSGDGDGDWTVAYEPSKERYERGLALIETDPLIGLTTASFTRIFFPNGDGNYGARRGLANEVLGLPKEDLDERTKVAKQMLDGGYTIYNREWK